LKTGTWRSYDVMCFAEASYCSVEVGLFTCKDRQTAEAGLLP